jgi:hypothetical protein
MLDAILNLAGLVLMLVVACHSIVLHRRLTRLKRALSDAGTVVPSLDASVGRMSEVFGGFASKLQGDLTTIETRLAAARRAAAELASVNRSAEEASQHLDRLLRQHRRLEDVRAAALPRELVEPKGFAERAKLPPVAAPPLPPTRGRIEPLVVAPYAARHAMIDELVS